jgi:hypothetical protein
MMTKEVILSKPQSDIFYSRQQVNLFMAGQGSGKTFIMGVISAFFMSHFPDARGLIAANTYDQLNRSTMFRIREVWAEYCQVTEYNEISGKGFYVIGKKPPKHFDTRNHNFDSYNNIISFTWGAVIYIGSLDNYKALDGIEVAWMLLDETKDTRKEALDEVLLGRLRQKGIYIDANGNLTLESQANQEFTPLYIFTSPAKVPWLNEKFGLDSFEAEIKSAIYFPPSYFKKRYENKLVTISATHLNSHNLPSNYITNQQKNLPKHLQGMLIYGDPFGKSGGEFIKTFDRSLHVANIQNHYDPSKTLHLSFDFNSHPYITCLAYQIEGKIIKQIKEFCLASPQNSTPALCEVLLRYFKEQIAKVYVYGDPSGKSGNRSTISKEKKSDYDVIFAMLRTQFKVVDRVLSSAPSVSVSGDFLNLIFEKEYEGIKMLIDEKCQKTISDLTYTKEAADGTMDKKKIKDETTGITYEPYGHCLDAKRYFTCSAFAQEFAKFQGKGSGKVLSTKRVENENAF